jgi:hypothetical protein
MSKTAMYIACRVFLDPNDASPTEKDSVRSWSKITSEPSSNGVERLKWFRRVST